jgi:hypothetical protein
VSIILSMRTVFGAKDISGTSITGEVGALGAVSVKTLADADALVFAAALVFDAALVFGSCAKIISSIALEPSSSVDVAVAGEDSLDDAITVDTPSLHPRRIPLTQKTVNGP